MAEEKQKIKLIIDTDVGTDCDDLFALAYAMQAMKSGKIDIKAIATVQEKNQVRAKIVRKLERMIGLDIPIISGAEANDEGYIKNNKRRESYCGFEHLALSEEELAEPLKKFTQIEYEKGDVLVGIGPLTNIAKQINENPSLGNVKDIYLMGLNEDSHNFKINLEAARNVVLNRLDIESLMGNALGDFLANSAKRWMDFSGKKELKMYDVLAVSAAMNEDYVRFFGNSKSAVSEYVNPILKEKLLEIAKK